MYMGPFKMQKFQFYGVYKMLSKHFESQKLLKVGLNGIATWFVSFVRSCPGRKKKTLYDLVLRGPIERKLWRVTVMNNLAVYWPRSPKGKGLLPTWWSLAHLTARTCHSLPSCTTTQQTSIQGRPLACYCTAVGIRRRCI
jgi:hypothetical protein